MEILATCLSFAAALAAANGGETIRLVGDCPAVTVAKVYVRPVTIEADRATVAGLSITGANITWNGGTLKAAGGTHGAGPSGYALRMVGAQNVRLVGALFTDAKKGAVIDQGRNIAIERSRFAFLGDDGMVVARTAGLYVGHNLFEFSVGKPTECTIPGAPMQYGLSGKACRELGGTWRDGYHPDAAQMFNGVTDALLEFNLVRGSTQGLTQMDSPGMAPLERITVRRNDIRTRGYHPITLGGEGCKDCRISENTVVREPGSPYKSVIIAGPAFRCGNIAPDDRTAEPACD